MFSFRFGSTPPDELARILLVAIVTSTIMGSLVAFLPQLMSIHIITSVLVRIIYAWVGCELVYYVLSALTKYLRE